MLDGSSRRGDISGTRSVVVPIVFLLVLLAAAPTIDGRDVPVQYVATPTPGILYQCDGGPHPIVPQGDPDPAAPFDWAHSGQPSCAPMEALNNTSDEERQGLGIGGYAVPLKWSDRGKHVLATPTDVYDPSGPYVRLFAGSSIENGSRSVEGCGPQGMHVPTFPASAPSGRLLPLWVYVDSFGIEEDGTVCFGSAGTLVTTIFD